MVSPYFSWTKDFSKFHHEVDAVFLYALTAKTALSVFRWRTVMELKLCVVGIYLLYQQYATGNCLFLMLMSLEPISAWSISKPSKTTRQSCWSKTSSLVFGFVLRIFYCLFISFSFALTARVTCNNFIGEHWSHRIEATKAQQMLFTLLSRVDSNFSKK